MFDDRYIKKPREEELYCALIRDILVDYNFKGQPFYRHDSWFAQIGPSLISYEYCEEGTGCCYYQMKIWEAASLREEPSCCKPCFEIKWNFEEVDVKTFAQNGWDRKLLGYISAAKRPCLSAACQFINEDNY